MLSMRPTITTPHGVLSSSSSMRAASNFLSSTLRTKSTIDPAILAAERQARMEAAAFSSLYDTVLAYFFSSYGYPRSVAQQVVSKESVREACAVAVEVHPSRVPIWVVDDNCTLDEVGRQLRAFVSREEYTYFLYYVAIAVPLITLAIVFNALAVLAVCRIRKRQPRHVIAISLSVSDVILSTTTLVKRCGVVEVDDGPLSSPVVRSILEQEVNVLWQSAFAMSALGLVCLAADNLVAVAAPFSYGQFSNSSWLVGVMPFLWITVLIIMIGLRLANLNYSVIVQYVVAAIICTLMFVILSAYGFTCFQAVLYRRRTNRWAQPEQKINLRKRLLKGFFTTTLLVLTCLLSWGPLVCYLLVDEEVVNAAHPVFLKFLLFCLSMFHLGAVLNPIIYSMRIRGIRLSLFQMLGMKLPSNAGGWAGQSTTAGYSAYKRTVTRRSNDGLTPSIRIKPNPNQLQVCNIIPEVPGLSTTDSQLEMTPLKRQRSSMRRKKPPSVDESVGPDVGMHADAPIIVLVPEPDVAAGEGEQLLPTNLQLASMITNKNQLHPFGGSHQQRWSDAADFMLNPSITLSNSNYTNNQQTVTCDEKEDGGDVLKQLQSTRDFLAARQQLKANGKNNVAARMRLMKSPKHRFSLPQLQSFYNDDNCV